MIELTIARRYALAFFEVGKEGGKAPLLYSEFHSFKEVCEQNPTLFSALKDTFIDSSSRVHVIEAVVAKLGFSQETQSFLKLLTKRNRISLLSFIDEALKDLVFILENKTEAVVTSARPLSNKVMEEVNALLSKISGKQVSVTQQIAPEVLGGISIRMDGMLFDGTIKGELQKISEQMRNSIE